VCGLAHYLEREGLPTVAIALIPRHAELMRPPRVLSVPFELGRPFGAPEMPKFQRAVMDHALGLLERTDGPVLETFPRRPNEHGASAVWSPPIEKASDIAIGEQSAFVSALKAEIAAIQPACESWVAGGGRRLDRISGRTTPEIVDLMLALAQDPSIESPMEGFSIELAAKFAADDLKHAYYQAGLSQPGTVTDVGLDDWFYNDTLAGKLMFALCATLLKSEDEKVRGFASHAFVPSHQRENVPEI
jgi:hypothetical protein